MSGRQDSNLRPPAPKAGAITGLRYAPILKLSSIKEQKIYLLPSDNKHLKNEDSNISFES